MQHAKNIRISSQQHQTSELGLMQIVEEHPSRGDMLLAENIECIIRICPRNFHKWMQNHSSINAAVHGICRSRGPGGGFAHTYPPTHPNVVSSPALPENIV